VENGKREINRIVFCRTSGIGFAMLDCHGFQNRPRGPVQRWHGLAQTRH
jgi:hypothetical protein